jgi:hypothetical protein
MPGGSTVPRSDQTSARLTASGRNAIGKSHKIRADALYLLHACGAEHRVLAFTDPGMLGRFERERYHGRFPPAAVIESRAIALPPVLADELCLA